MLLSVDCLRWTRSALKRRMLSGRSRSRRLRPKLGMRWLLMVRVLCAIEGGSYFALTSISESCLGPAQQPPDDGGPGMLTLGGLPGVNAAVNATVAVGDYNGALDMFDDIMGLGPAGYHAWATNGTGMGFLGAVANASGAGDLRRAGVGRHQRRRQRRRGGDRRGGRHGGGRAQHGRAGDLQPSTSSRRWRWGPIPATSCCSTETGTTRRWCATPGRTT